MSSKCDFSSFREVCLFTVPVIYEAQNSHWHQLENLWTTVASTDIFIFMPLSKVWLSPSRVKLSSRSYDSVFFKYILYQISWKSDRRLSRWYSLSQAGWTDWQKICYGLLIKPCFLYLARNAWIKQVNYMRGNIDVFFGNQTKYINTLCG